MTFTHVMVVTTHHTVSIIIVAVISECYYIKNVAGQQGRSKLWISRRRYKTCEGKIIWKNFLQIYRNSQNKLCLVIALEYCNTINSENLNILK